MYVAELRSHTLASFTLHYRYVAKQGNVELAGTYNIARLLNFRLVLFEFNTIFMGNFLRISTWEQKRGKQRNFQQ